MKLSGHDGDDEISKIAAQAVAQFKKSHKKMKYLLMHLNEKYKQIMIQNQKILVNILKSPRPMTEKQIKDLKKSLTISVKLVAYIKSKGMIDKETQKQLYGLIKNQRISIGKLNEVKVKMNNNVDKNKDTIPKAANVQLMTKDQLRAFKKANKDDKFIDTPDKDVRVINANEVDTFKNNHPDANIININKKDRLTDKQKIKAFKEYQTNFVSTLYEMLDDGQIEGVTEDQLEELQDFEDISVDALTKLMAGQNLDEKTKKTLKEYQSHLIMVINGIVERDIDKKTKHDLEKFKTTHTYFIFMIFKMHSGEKFDMAGKD